MREQGALAEQLDHRRLISSLSAEQRQRLTTLADLPGVLQLAAHLGLIVALGLLVAAAVPWWTVLLLPQGILIVFLFTALHETAHGTAFRSTWLNGAVAHLAGCLILIPPTWFKYFHFAHHRHTHDPAHDPELMSPKPTTVWQYVTYLSGIPLWASMAQTVWANACGRVAGDYLPKRARPRMVTEARAMLAGYAVLLVGSIVSGSTLLAWVWIVPILLGQPFLRGYLLAEHARCPHVANMLENTRTTFTNRLVRFLAWNMPYHAEHHAYPTVPFHQLPTLHDFARGHLRQTERGYGRFNWKFWQAVTRG